MTNFGVNWVLIISFRMPLFFIYKPTDCGEIPKKERSYKPGNCDGIMKPNELRFDGF